MRPRLSLPGVRPAFEPVEKIDIGAEGRAGHRRDGRIEVEVRRRATGGAPAPSKGEVCHSTGVLDEAEHEEVRRALGLDEASVRRALGVDEWRAKRGRA